MAQRHRPRRRQETDTRPQHVPQGPVRIGDSVEQVREFAFRRAGAQLSVAAQHIHFQDALVDKAVAAGARLDADAGDGPAHGDGLELRDHRRHEAVQEAGVGEVLEGRHALDVGPSLVFIDGNCPIQGARI